MRHNHGISSCSSRRTNASNSSREVLPFTPHAGKPGTIIRAPPSVSFAASSTIKSVAFRRVYDCGDLPAAVLHDSQGRKISWKVKIILLYLEKYNCCNILMCNNRCNDMTLL